jgi:hypothetical protein
VEPPTATERSILWPYLQAAAAAHAGDVAIVLRAAMFGPDDAIGAARGARAATQVSAEVALATRPGPLQGVALEHARGMISAALVTLERLADEGWPTVAGTPPGPSAATATTRDAAAERTETFDPFEATLGRRP